MRDLLQLVRSWFKKGPDPVIQEIMDKEEVKETIIPPPPINTHRRDYGPVELATFDRDSEAAEFIKKHAYKDYKIEVVTPTMEGKTAVIYRRRVHVQDHG